MVSVLFVPKTGGSVLQKRLQQLEPGLSAISGERVRYVERTGVTMKQMLHRNNPWAGAPCYKADSCLSCASDKDIKDNCSKRSILYEVHCRVCRQQAELDKAAGKDWVDYIYVGQTSESCFVRGNSHMTDMKAGMKGQCDTSHMAAHIIMTHGGVASEAKFIMKKIKSYLGTSDHTRCRGCQYRVMARRGSLWLLLTVQCKQGVRGGRLEGWTLKPELRAKLIASRRSSILCRSREKPVTRVQIS